MPLPSLFRHAKSSWSDPRLSDFDRPLAPRGKKAAPRMGAYMARAEVVPDLIVCSTAVRARETLERSLPQMGQVPEILYEEALYHAGPAKLLRRVNRMPEDCAHAMLIGHNPGMHSLVLDLVGSGDADLIEAMAHKFPTAALAVIAFDVAWAHIGPGEGRLVQYMAPKRLPDKATAGKDVDAA